MIIRLAIGYTGLQCGDGQPNQDSDIFSWQFFLFEKVDPNTTNVEGFRHLAFLFCLFYRTFCVATSAVSAAAG